MKLNFPELIELLKNADSAEELDLHREEIANVIPEVRRMFGFDQRNYAHQYDLWMHCLHTVTGLKKKPDDDMLYLAALLHDIGKLETGKLVLREGKPNMRYPGHPEKSVETVKAKILPYLKKHGIQFTGEERYRLLYYIRCHDEIMSEGEASRKKQLDSGVTREEFRNLMLLEIADAEAHIQVPLVKERIRLCSLLL